MSSYITVQVPIDSPSTLFSDHLPAHSQSLFSLSLIFFPILFLFLSPSIYHILTLSFSSSVCNTLTHWESFLDIVIKTFRISFSLCLSFSQIHTFKVSPSHTVYTPPLLPVLFFHFSLAPERRAWREVAFHVGPGGLCLLSEKTHLVGLADLCHCLFPLFGEKCFKTLVNV